MALLEVKNVSYYYQDGDNKREILKDTSVTFERGNFYTIVGESGSGKTTFLSLIGALDRPKSGEILLKGHNIYEDVKRYRQKDVGFVFQSYNLIPYMTAVENVSLALDIAHLSKKINIKGILAIVGITEDKTERVVTKLSGGEQQRVAIARAIAKSPTILLADEPTGNLDTDTSDFIVNIFNMLAHKMNMCVIMVTHNLEIAKRSDIVYRVDPKIKKLVTDNV